MSHKIPLFVAVKQGIVRSTDFVDYVPDKACVTFTPKETNSHFMQTAETEYNLGGFHPISYKKDFTRYVYLVPTFCSKFKLEIVPNVQNCTSTILQRRIGENQFKIGATLLRRYAQIYDNKELGVEAIPFNEKLFNVLKWNTISPNDCYYLSDTFTYQYHFFSRYPLCSHEQSIEYDLYMGLKWIAHSMHSYIHDNEPISKASIRIAIPIHHNILVEINNPQYDGSSVEKAFRISHK